MNNPHHYEVGGFCSCILCLMLLKFWLYFCSLLAILQLLPQYRT